MSLPDGTPSAAEVGEFLREINSRGVRLWSERGQLRYKAPKGALTETELLRLRASKDQLIACLDTGQWQEASRSLSLTRAPLAFSQLAHWRLYQLAQRPSVRQVAAALRLRGLLSVTTLRESVSIVVGRHDALRTRIVLAEDIPRQEIGSSRDVEIPLIDLTCVDESRRDTELHQQIEAAIERPIDVSRDSLIATWLWRTQPNEHVLLVAMEHMISDMASMDICLREILTAYEQLLQEGTVLLPPVRLQFSDYACLQRNSHPQWLQCHGTYWERRLRDCPRQRLSGGDLLSPTNITSWTSVPLSLGITLKSRLREWCRAQRTSPAIALFTAYVALILRWCAASEVVVRYQGNGRPGQQTQHSIGFFASRLYLRLEIQPRDRLTDLTHQVTQEYCGAYEHDDFSYLETKTPAPACDRNTFFNYIPQTAPIGLPALRSSPHELILRPVSFANPWVKQLTWDNEPMAMLFETEDGVSGAVYYPAQRLSAPTMERFARNYLAMVERLLTRAQDPVASISLV